MKIPNRLHTETILRENFISYNFLKKWGFLIEEMRQQREDVKAVLVPTQEVTDTRNVKPFPNTTNHEYGWLSYRPEFRLETFGPDIPKSKPLPEIYKIRTDVLCTKP